MTKDVPQDIIPPKKTIRNIPIPASRTSAPSHYDDVHTDVAQPYHDEIVAPETETLTIRKRSSKRESTVDVAPLDVSETIDQEVEEVYEQRTPQRRVVSFDETPDSFWTTKRTGVAVGIGVACILGVLFIFLSFGGATVTVTPKQITSTLKTEVVAQKTGIASTSSLTFTTELFTAEATQEVTATGEEIVVTKSTGTITIYNEYSEDDQRLVKNTRFATEDGKIYRIQEAVVVPGLTRDEKGNVIPGTRITQVVADQPGKEYNIGPSRFNIPGFDGLPQYTAFYAKSTTAMSGGYNGVKKIISETDRNNTERTLREEIKKDLISQATTKNTNDTRVLIDDSLTTYETLDEVVNGDQVTLGMRGTTNAVIVNVHELAYALAQQDLNSFAEKDSVQITNLDTINVRVFKNALDNTLETVRIAVEGDAVFEWKLNKDMFAKALAGKKKDELVQIMPSFNSITKAEAHIRPIWNQTFPTNPEKINIVSVTE